ncbi:MAG: alpha/beta hydrolase [Lachnospiraceae bacterium]|nr:alpha/beta hydrolase [Lachnospiraceae bacterium]
MNQIRLKKWIKRVLMTVLLLLIVIDLLAGNYLVSFALLRSNASGVDVAPTPVTSDEISKKVDEIAKEQGELTDKWFAQAEKEIMTIRSKDGLALYADLVTTDKNSHKWAIAIHGYSGKRAHTYNYARFYAEQGYNILMPDMRAHGESEGTYIGMGWLDKEDVILWIDQILEKDPAAEIVLHGVSMGGATVMMTSGEQLPDNVKAIIDDCGYTSVWDVFSDEAKYLFHIPEFPILYTASAISRIRAGYTFGEASAIGQVRKTNVPIYFIHGSKDNFVHTDMVYELYEACPTQKGLYVVEGAGHGQAMYVDPEQYFRNVFEFIDSVKQEK